MRKIKWKSVLALFVVITMLPAFPVFVQAYSANLALELRFENNITDGAGNSVTVHGTTPTFLAGVDGNGMAASIRGNANISIGNNARLNPANLTVSLWYKPNGTMSGEHFFMWTKGNYNTEGWYFGSEDDNRPLILSVGTGNTQPYEIRVSGMTRSSFFPPNEWTHIAATYNSTTREAKIYRNGIEQVVGISNSGSPGIITNGGTTAYIGRNGAHGNDDTRQINGDIDDFLIFDAPLTHSEILDIYEEKKAFDATDLLAADAAALSLPSRTNSNLILPTEGKSGSTITWESNNPEVITNTGIVTPPEFGEVNVTMTATLQSRGKTTTRALIVTVYSSEFAPVVLEDVGTNNVTLHDPYLLNAELKDINLLLSLEPMRFLAHFYTTAELTRPSVGTMRDPVTNELLSPSGATPYNTLNGEATWERSTDNNFRGHMFGHYMSAMSMAYKATDDADIKARLLARIKECITELQKCQDATYSNSVNDGYIGPFGDRLLDTHNNGTIDGLSVGGGVQEGTVFVPWYNLHKVYAGLIDTYKSFQGISLDAPIVYQGNTFTDLGLLALDIVSRYGDYFYDTRVVNYTQTNRNNLLRIEYGGMNDMFYELYKLTRSPKHKAAAECFDENSLFDSLAAGTDVLPGKHANTQVPKFVGALNRYTTLTQDADFYNNLTTTEKTQLESRYFPAVENFFDIVLRNHSYITGGQSQGEHFRQPNTMAATIQSNDTHETCNEYNMLKVARGMFKITQDKKYADYYENVLINAILSSQNPETGYMMYFQPMGSGYNKVFGFNRFWCCVGTGIENFVKLGDSIYFTKDDRVYVNMYFSSELSYEERNLKLAQDSNLYFSDRSKPFSETVKFTVDRINNTEALGKTDLYLRQPDWCVGNALVKVNGQPIATPTMSGGYIVLRNVAIGDAIEITFPMEVAIDALEDNPNVVAFKYGPLVLSTGLGNWNINATSPNGILVLVAQRDSSAPSAIVLNDGQKAEEWKANLTNNLVRVEDAPNGEPQFRLKGTNMDNTLLYTPHYQRYNERYGLYMTLIDDPDSPVIQDIMYKNKLEARESENTSAYLSQFDGHAYEGGYVLDQTGTITGDYNGRQYRASSASNTEGAYFSYELPIVPDTKNYLNTVLARADNGRSWFIYINNELFTTETVTNDTSQGTSLDSNFYTMTREIPEQYTTGDGLLVKQVDGKSIPYVKVEFRRDNGWLGRLFGLSITQRALLFDNNPNLQALEFNGGTLNPPFDPEIKEYTLTPDVGTTSVSMLATPNSPSGIVTIDGIIIDDTQRREIQVPKYLTLKSYAQNHLTATTYNIAIGNATNPGKSEHEDPRVWYKMDESSGTTIADSSGYGHANGTTSGSPSFIVQDGIRGLNLNGSNRHVVLPRTIFRDALGDFTLSTMVYFRSGNTWSRIFDFGPNSGSNIMFLTADTLQLNMDNVNTLTAPSSSNNANNANRWRMITISYSGGVTTMYIDGVAVATGTQSPTANRTTSSGNFYLGRSNWSGDPYPNMILSDFRIYSKGINSLEAAVMYGKPQLNRAFDSITIASVLNKGDSLPQSIAGFPIKWSSSDPSILAADGYTIISKTTENQVTLTATIPGNSDLEKTFEATITGSNANVTWNQNQLTAGQTLTATLNYSDIVPVGKNVPATTYLALFDGEDNLVSISTTDFTITSTDPENTIDISLQLPTPLPTNAKVKLYLWSDNQEPLIEAIPFIPSVS